MRLALLAALMGVALAAQAQQQPKLEPLPDVPPPPIIESDPDNEPQVTIIQRGDETVEEFRLRGKLYMVKVTPRHGVPYYLVDRKGDGNLVRTEALEPAVSVPMWVIKSW